MKDDYRRDTSSEVNYSLISGNILKYMYTTFECHRKKCSHWNKVEFVITWLYSEVPIIRPSLVLVGSALNSEHVS